MYHKFKIQVKFAPCQRAYYNERCATLVSRTLLQIQTIFFLTLTRTLIILHGLQSVHTLQHTATHCNTPARARFCKKSDESTLPGLHLDC
mmetsp:Transcript_59154/g.95619  ORF Transcript_59154/g.95619 Transcript_59154/m.95619 type:complete len:90 (+) Transcript_59154:153-422(+)